MKRTMKKVSQGASKVKRSAVSKAQSRCTDSEKCGEEKVGRHVPGQKGRQADRIEIECASKEAGESGTKQSCENCAQGRHGCGKGRTPGETGRRYRTQLDRMRLDQSL